MGEGGRLSEDSFLDKQADDAREGRHPNLF